jgi:ABC-type branched-subunit amino acid transport system ATPase component
MLERSLPMLSVDHLSRRYGGVQVLSGVSLSLAEGAIAVITGRNGSGKTTLVNCLSGFDLSYKGVVKAFGINIRHMTADERARLGVVRTFQYPHLFPEFSVADHLELGRAAKTTAIQTYAQTWRESTQSALLVELELAELAPRRSNQLSFGEMKLLNLARALATGARVLLLDEPLASLHDHLRKLAVRAIARRAQAGCALLVIEHDLRLLADIMTAGYTLESGSLRACA